MHDIIRVRGIFSYELLDEKGNLIESNTYKNVVVQVGREWIVQRMASDAPVKMGYLALGTWDINQNTTLQTVGDTQLENEQVRVAMLNGFGDTFQNTIIYKARFVEDVPPFLLQATEAGIFNDAAPNGGVMLCRTTFPVISKRTTDVLNVTWTITIEGTV